MLILKLFKTPTRQPPNLKAGWIITIIAVIMAWVHIALFLTRYPKRPYWNHYSFMLHSHWWWPLVVAERVNIFNIISSSYTIWMSEWSSYLNNCSVCDSSICLLTGKNFNLCFAFKVVKIKTPSLCTRKRVDMYKYIYLQKEEKFEEW